MIVNFGVGRCTGYVGRSVYPLKVFPFESDMGETLGRSRSGSTGLDGSFEGALRSTVIRLVGPCAASMESKFQVPPAAQVRDWTRCGDVAEVRSGLVGFKTEPTTSLCV